MIPKAIGPYSAYRVSGNFVFTSGQLPLNPVTNLIELDDIKGQTKQALKNVEAILTEVGINMTSVIKTTVLLTDINEFTAMNEVYGEFFSGNYPSRICYQVAALPMGAKIEIEVIAEIGVE